MGNQFQNGIQERSIKELIHNLCIYHLLLSFFFYTACICMPSLYEIIDAIMLHEVKLCVK